MLDLSPAGIKREAKRWKLHDETHVHLYKLWRNYSGMGGETLSSLLDLAQRPGSAALLADFNTIHARIKRLKAMEEFRGRMH